MEQLASGRPIDADTSHRPGLQRHNIRHRRQISAQTWPGCNARPAGRGANNRTCTPIDDKPARDYIDMTRMGSDSDCDHCRR